MSRSCELLRFTWASLALNAASASRFNCMQHQVNIIMSNDQPSRQKWK
jgi:hypothetical protein